MTPWYEKLNYFSSVFSTLLFCFETKPFEKKSNVIYLFFKEKLKNNKFMHATNKLIVAHFLPSMLALSIQGICEFDTSAQLLS